MPGGCARLPRAPRNADPPREWATSDKRRYEAEWWAEVRLAQVKPDHHSGSGQALRRSRAPDHFVQVVSLEPNAQSRECRSRREERGQANAILCSPGAAPSDDAGENKRQHRDRSLAQQTQPKSAQAKPIPPSDRRRPIRRRGRRFAFQEPMDRQQIKQHCQQVLSLRNPRDRFHVHRMHGEKHRCQIPPAQPDLAQHRPEQQRLTQVQGKIGRMVSQRVQAPQPPLQPEACVRDRPVIGRLRREPDSPQSIGRLDQRVLGQHAIVVPDEPCSKRRPVSYQRQCAESGASPENPRPRPHAVGMAPRRSSAAYERAREEKNRHSRRLQCGRSL